MCSYSELFWSAFSRIGLNTEKHGISLCIQSECGKMLTRITPDTDTFNAVILVQTTYFRLPSHFGGIIFNCFFQCGFLRLKSFKKNKRALLSFQQNKGGFSHYSRIPNKRFPRLFLFSNKTLTATLKVILNVIPSRNRYAVTNEKCDTKKNWLAVYKVE